MAFANDNDDQLPREDAADGVNSWALAANPTNSCVWYNASAKEAGVHTLSDYASSAASQPLFYERNLFTCPAAKFDPAKKVLNPLFSIAMNSKLIDLNPIGRLSDIQQPTRTALFLESGVPGEDRYFVGMTGQQTEYNGQPKAFASRFSARHGKAGNLVFADGHAQTYPGNKVVNTDENSSNPGKNIIGGEILWWADGHQ